MAEYITHVVLHRKGEIHFPGARVNMSEEEAAKFGKRLTLAEIAQPEKPLEEKTAKELRSLAKAADVPKYWEKDKAALLSDLKAVSNNEPNNG